MAYGVPFEEANDVLLAAPEDAAAGTVYDLHIHRYVASGGVPVVISKWQLTPEELAEVNGSGGVLWFSALGHTHPPVALSGTDPFDRTPPEG